MLDAPAYLGFSRNKVIRKDNDRSGSLLWHSLLAREAESSEFTVQVDTKFGDVAIYSKPILSRTSLPGCLSNEKHMALQTDRRRLLTSEAINSVLNKDNKLSNCSKLTGAENCFL